MYDVVFNSGFIGLLIWILLFASSTATAVLVIRCAWILRRKRFGSATVFEQLMSLLKVGDWDLERTDRAKIIDPLIETIVFDSAKETLEINYHDHGIAVIYNLIAREYHMAITIEKPFSFTNTRLRRSKADQPQVSRFLALAMCYDQLLRTQTIPNFNALCRHDFS